MPDSSPPPLHVALVIDQLTFNRLGPVIQHLAVGMLDEISKLTLITPAAAALDLSLGPVEVVNYHRNPWPFWQRGVERVIEACGKRPPTIVHALSHRSLRLALALADRWDRPLVAHLLSSSDVEGLSVAANTTSRVAAVIAASGPLLDAAHAAGMTDARLIRPGLLTSGAPASFSRPALSPSILCMSAFEEETGVARLIEATRRLVDSGHEFMVLLLGDGPDEARLRKQVEWLGLIRHVTFGQRVLDWEMIMSTADLFVVPGDVDRVDVRLLHAMASGIAPVTCNMPNSDFLIHGETGLQCPDPSPRALAEALDHLLRDRPLAKRLAAAALARCKSHHSLSAMVTKTAELYHEVVRRGTAVRLVREDPPAAGPAGGA